MPQTLLTDLAETKLAQAAGDGSAVAVKYVALGDANGVAYDPSFDQTALRGEIARREIESHSIFGQNSWRVNCTFPANETPVNMIREIGFFDVDGDLIAIWAGTDVTPRQVGVVDYALKHVLSFQRVADELVVIEAPLDIEEALNQDLSSKHNLDEDFNFELTRNIEHWQGQSAEALEAAADVYRASGQSGVLMGRHYGFGGDASFHRPSAVSFAALGVHDHPNYPFMSGLPELHAVVNGYRVNMRHVDYRWFRPVAGAYLAVDAPTPPPVPASVAAQATPEGQVNEMREYLRAFARKDHTHRDYRDHFDVYLSYLEVWFEEFKGDALADTALSFRHQLDSDSLKEMMQKYIALNASGLKPRFENSSFMPGFIRSVDREGQPQFSVLRYRVGAVRIGSYRDYPVHDMVSLVDDPATRARKGYSDNQIELSRLGRFRVNHAIGDTAMKERNGPSQLDALMSIIPGLDGDGSNLTEIYTDTDANGDEFQQRLMQYGTTNLLNSAYYNRHYSFEHSGAAGRRDYRRGFNDPTLFVAATTKTEVTAVPGMGGNHRLSWAVPMELMIASPIAGWNPYNVAEVDNVTGTGATSGAALNGVNENGTWFMCPASLFTGDNNPSDPADTSLERWVKDDTGTPRLMAGSGVYVHLPRIAGEPTMRMRYPIAPIHHEGSFAHAVAEAMREEQREVALSQAAAIAQLQHKMISEN